MTAAPARSVFWSEWTPALPRPHAGSDGVLGIEPIAGPDSALHRRARSRRAGRHKPDDLGTPAAVAACALAAVAGPLVPTDEDNEV